MSSRREGTSVSLFGCGLLFQGQEQQQVTTIEETTVKGQKKQIIGLLLLSLLLR